MKAANYARVSTSDGRQDTDNQLAQLRQFATSQNWKIAGEYLDHGSGKTADRQEFKRLLSDAAQRRCDVVLFWALDRCTRQLPYCLRAAGGVRSVERCHCNRTTLRRGYHLHL